MDVEVTGTYKTQTTGRLISALAILDVVVVVVVVIVECRVLTVVVRKLIVSR